jgi:hypothetical protein
VPFFIFVQTSLPVFYVMRSRRARKLTEANSETSGNQSTVISTKASFKNLKEELLEVRRNPETRKLFLLFLQSEFNVENLLYIEACESFEHLLAQEQNDKAQQLALLIRDNFVSVNAPSSVNLPSTVRFELLAKLASPETVSLTTFQAAMIAITDITASDPFLRFKNAFEIEMRLTQLLARPSIGASEL